MQLGLVLRMLRICLIFNGYTYLQSFTASRRQLFIEEGVTIFILYIYIYVIFSSTFILTYYTNAKIHNNVFRAQRIVLAQADMTSHGVSFRATFVSDYPCTVSSLNYAR